MMAFLNSLDAPLIVLWWGGFAGELPTELTKKRLVERKEWFYLWTVVKKLFAESAKRQ